MMKSHFTFVLGTIALACAGLCHAFTICHECKAPSQLYATRTTHPNDTKKSISSNPSSQSYNRAIFLQTLSVGLLSVVNIDLANAQDESKGTKDDPKFQACISKCVFECTKPKGEEQKSRSECLPECRTKCATTKQQLMTGKPLKKGT